MSDHDNQQQQPPSGALAASAGSSAADGAESALLQGWALLVEDASPSAEKTKTSVWVTLAKDSLIFTKEIPNEAKFAPRNVKLTKGKDGLGLTVKGGKDAGLPAIIWSVTPDGPAAESNQVFPGDLILEVDGQSIVGQSQKDVVATLKKTSRTVKLKLQLSLFARSHIPNPVLDSDLDAPSATAIPLHREDTRVMREELTGLQFELASSAAVYHLDFFYSDRREEFLDALKPLVTLLPDPASLAVARAAAALESSAAPTPASPTALASAPPSTTVSLYSDRPISMMVAISGNRDDSDSGNESSSGNRSRRTSGASSAKDAILSAVEAIEEEASSGQGSPSTVRAAPLSKDKEKEKKDREKREKEEAKRLKEESKAAKKAELKKRESDKKSRDTMEPSSKRVSKLFFGSKHDAKGSSGTPLQTSDSEGSTGDLSKRHTVSFDGPLSPITPNSPNLSRMSMGNELLTSSSSLNAESPGSISPSHSRQRSESAVQETKEFSLDTRSYSRNNSVDPHMSASSASLPSPLPTSPTLTVASPEASGSATKFDIPSEPETPAAPAPPAKPDAVLCSYGVGHEKKSSLPGADVYKDILKKMAEKKIQEREANLKAFRDKVAAAEQKEKTEKAKELKAFTSDPTLQFKTMKVKRSAVMRAEVDVVRETVAIIEVRRATARDAMLEYFRTKLKIPKRPKMKKGRLSKKLTSRKSVMSEKAQKAAKRKARRMYIVQEMLSTEVSYVQGLNVLVDVFLAPLRQSAASPKPLLSESDIKKIFANLETIVQLNGKFLADLKSRVESWTADSILGDVFLEVSDFFRLYAHYVNNFPLAMSTIEKRQMQSAAFKDFLKTSAARPECKSFGLKEIMLTPIQRIPRYKLLLEDLVKHTDDDHPDYQTLKKALEAMKALATYLNDAKREAEMRREMVEITERIKDCPPLITTNRKFIAEFPMEEISLKQQDVQNVKQADRSFRVKHDCDLFLFDDIVVIAKRSGGRNSANLDAGAKKGATKRVQFDSMLSVAELSIKEVSWFATTPELVNAFQLKKFPTTERTLRAPSPKVKAAFIKHFQDAQDEYRKQMLSDGGLMRPVSTSSISSVNDGPSNVASASSIPSIHLEAPVSNIYFQQSEKGGALSGLKGKLKKKTSNARNPTLSNPTLSNPTLSNPSIASAQSSRANSTIDLESEDSSSSETSSGTESKRVSRVPSGGSADKQSVITKTMSIIKKSTEAKKADEPETPVEKPKSRVKDSEL